MLSRTLSRQPSQPQLQLGHRASHKSSWLANALYNASLFSLVVLVSIVLLASGYDVVQQVVVASRGNIRFTDTAITGAGYVLVGIISTLIAFSRMYTVKQVLASIPKAYIPTGRDELTKNTYRLVASEYTRCAMIVHASRPKGRVLPGWGDPGSEYAGVRFRTAILDTLSVLERSMPTVSSASTKTPIPTSSRHASPLAKYIPLLQAYRTSEVSSLLLFLGEYERVIEDARWKLEEPTREDYEVCIKLVATIGNVVKKMKDKKQTEEAVQHSPSTQMGEERMQSARTIAEE